MWGQGKRIHVWGSHKPPPQPQCVFGTCCFSTFLKTKYLQPKVQIHHQVKYPRPTYTSLIYRSLFRRMPKFLKIQIYFFKTFFSFRYQMFSKFACYHSNSHTDDENLIFSKLVYNKNIQKM